MLSTAEDQSLTSLVRDQYATNPNLAMRPTQVVYQAFLFRLFGLEPLGYHLVNLGVLIAVAVLLSLVLRELRLPRGLAVAVPAVYALMPNYATARFWFASFGYLLGMALYLLALYADLRAASSEHRRTVWTWKALALVTLTTAAFGYEVVIPLFLLNIGLAEVVARRLPSRGFRARMGPAGTALLHGSTLAVAVAAGLYKASVAVGVGVGSSPLRYTLWLGSSSVATNFGTHGVGLPHTVGWALPHAGIGGVAIAILVGLGIYRYLAVVRDPRSEGDALPFRGGWLRMGVVGLVVFALGYSIFLTTGRIAFSSTGIANRVATAGALGAAIVLVGAVGWIASRLRSPRLRDRAFRAGIAALCLSGIVVVNGLASFWVQSWEEQREVLADLDAAFPRLAPGSTVLLGGVCPYVGPAIVFESSWDLQGALRVRHGDKSVDGDVTSGVVSAEPQGVVTQIYQVEVMHPYGARLFLYDRRAGTTTVLVDQSAARRALSTQVSGTDCPEGRPGAGTIDLPFDVLFHWFRSRIGL
ncbi:MAG TPA: hypothetical protein VF058_02030 [Actinomycetota bacterium]